MTLLLEGKDAQAQQMMDQFKFTGDTPALYYAKAAWAFKHDKTPWRPPQPAAAAPGPVAIDTAAAIAASSPVPVLAQATPAPGAVPQRRQR